MSVRVKVVVFIVLQGSKTIHFLLYRHISSVLEL